MEITTNNQQFVVRRAFRFGRVDRADVREGLGLAEAQASRLLTAVAQQRDDLKRLPRWVEPKPWLPPPKWASAVDLMRQLDGGETAFHQTGLRADELPVVRVRWTALTPEPHEALDVLMHAIVQAKQCAIAYVSLKVGEKMRWREIAPLGLEQMGDQWRVIAHVFDEAKFPVRTFVLARIRDAQLIEKRAPKGLTLAAAHDGRVSLTVVLDGRFSQEQRDAMEYELGIKKGQIELPRRSLFEFGRRFGHTEVSPDAVWPPIKFINDKD